MPQYLPFCTTAGPALGQFYDCHFYLSFLCFFVAKKTFEANSVKRFCVMAGVAQGLSNGGFTRRSSGREQGQFAFLCGSQLRKKLRARYEFRTQCFEVRCQHLDIDPVQATLFQVLD